MNRETPSTQRESITSKLNAFRSRHPSVDTRHVELYIKCGLFASATKLLSNLSRTK